MQDLSSVTNQYQQIKRDHIQHDENLKQREETIEVLKVQFAEIQIKYDTLTLDHGTLNLHYAKEKETLESTQKELDDASEKLHLTNKVRHETEVKLGSAFEKARDQDLVIIAKDDDLSKRHAEIDELDKKVINLERNNENLEIRRSGMERQFELTKKQLNERVNNLNEIINGERETRDMWIERYEKEHKDHTIASAQLLHEKSDHKDLMLESKNIEIRLKNADKQIEIMSAQNKKYQDTINDALARADNYNRELLTQKEILKQYEHSKKEIVQRLRNELDTVEVRFLKVINENNMVGEDYRMRASVNWERLVKERAYNSELKKAIEKERNEIGQFMVLVPLQESIIEDQAMNIEDYAARIQNHLEQFKDKEGQILGLTQSKEGLELEIKDLS